jgi:hypothetical protein
MMSPPAGGRIYLININYAQGVHAHNTTLRSLVVFVLYNKKQLLN